MEFIRQKIDELYELAFILKKLGASTEDRLSTLEKQIARIDARLQYSEDAGNIIDYSKDFTIN